MPFVHQESARVLTASLTAAALAALAGCASSQSSSTSAADVPAAAAPAPPFETVGRPSPVPPRQIDLTAPGAVVTLTTPATIIDSRNYQPQIREERWDGPPRAVRNFLPPHPKPPKIAEEAPVDLPFGGLLAEQRTVPQQNFVTITATGWVPPDPTLAVGPNHVVVTVNQSIAWYTKSGTQQFQQILGNQGSPGFFEPVGAGGFTFDPKVFYDHFAQRFVVVAPEVYGTTEAWITIAVSDDSDPNGTWYKYRTDAVINISGNLYWWDYPGFGFDNQAYYVTCNLFPLANGGFGGVGFRIFNKAPMLTGAPVSFSTLRDSGGASVQVAQHFGTPIAPYFISAAGSSSVRIQAITNPITAPAIASINVNVPGYSAPVNAPVPGGSVSAIDARMMNAAWRNGRLTASHGISSGGRALARWYEFNTNNWPTSGAPSLIQSGNIDGGAGFHTFFPAIYSNRFNDIGIVVGGSSSSSRVGVYTTGRLNSDPAGFMGALTLAKAGEADGAGRWGDYQDIAIDPVDDSTFWVIGEYNAPGGWRTWVSSFQVAGSSPMRAINDAVGNVITPASRLVDVLANDFHTGSQSFVIDSFSATSSLGGSVSRSVGTGPGGRDQLLYTPPNGVNGNDSFTYTARSSGGNTGTATVTATLTDSSTFRNPENPARTRAELDVGIYALTNPSVLPDFSLLTPVERVVVPNINFPSTTGPLFGSSLADNVGAQFVGYFEAPANDVYTFNINSDDGSNFYVGNVKLVDNDGLHGPRDRAAPIGLKAGKHAIRVDYFDRTGGAQLILSASRLSTGEALAVIPAAQFSRDNTCVADLTGDGQVDLADYFEFFNCYDSELPCADIDGNPGVDLADFFLFFAEFDSPSC